MPTIRGTKIAKADVLWWDACHVCIRCPFCDKVHRHGFSEYPSRITQSRVPHCGHPRNVIRDYKFCFPFNEETGKAWYWVDKKRCLFITEEGAKALEEQEKKENEDTQLAQQLEQMELEFDQKKERPRFDDAKEKFKPFECNGTVIDDMKIMNSAISRCIVGDVAYVHRYLRNSKEKDLFLKGTDAEGNTTLIHAAMEKSTGMVRLLLEHGAEVNVARADGRTPLMIATLWGRRDSVQVMLDYGAKKDAISAGGFRAIDPALPSKRNDEERNRTCLLYVDTKKDDILRKDIVQILQPARNVDLQQTSRLPSSAQAFKKSPEDSMMYHLSPISAIYVERQSKTVACLDRGEGFPLVYSKSGWGHGESNLIDGGTWTNEVLRIASKIGYKIPAHDCDQGKPGQYNASHAEKQLMAFFITRHVFERAEILPWDDEQERINQALKQRGDWSSTPLPPELVDRLRYQQDDWNELSPLNP